MTTTTDIARVYVGTYAKYNSGSIAGAWIDLEGHDAETFLEACRELHNDEHDPEFMFQDYEGFPRAYYNEGFMTPAIWEWLELDEHDRELFTIYADILGWDDNYGIEQARDAYMGTFRSPEEWAEEYLDEMGTFENVHEGIKRFFDYEAYARDSEMIFVTVNGDTWVFSNY